MEQFPYWRWQQGRLVNAQLTTHVKCTIHFDGAKNIASVVTTCWRRRMNGV